MRRARQWEHNRVAGESPDLSGVYRIRMDVDAGGGIPDLLETLRRNPNVEYAELSHVISICRQPDDPEYNRQWGMEKIAAPDAWETCRGSDDVVIAVIDTGVDYAHRDLQSNVWCNEAELHGAPGEDDDDNGYVDDVHGYNFVYNNGDPNDDHGHGTQVAGIAAAVGNNGLDVAGVCWTARIMVLKILDAAGDGASADAAPAIYYAVANGADVISMSWGSEEDSRVIEDAIAYARRQGVIVVAAAGNEGSDTPFYPAAYPDVLAVAATDSSDRRHFLSNYGDWVDIAAPGRDILSLRAGGVASLATDGVYTVVVSGTSMATPHVTGACALLLAANPLLAIEEVERIVLSTGDPIAAGICASNSRLNVGRAMHAAVPSEGAVRFDQPAYAKGDEIGVLLADGDLGGTGTQSVSVVTDGGDEEEVTLAETLNASGVFRDVVGSESGGPRPGDGRIQAEHGERIVVRYLNADDGSATAGQWIEAYAHADYQAPALTEQTVEIRGATARIELLTSEPTRAEIRYADTQDGPFSLNVKDAELSGRHAITIGKLTAATTYYFLVALADEAGNEAIVDNEGRYYSFEIGDDFAGFRVPSVYPTIQAAIDDAWDGDTVWVADGTYWGEGNIEIDCGGKAISVRSENGPQSCIIDCRQEGRAFSFCGGEGKDSVLEGFTITNGGNVDYGGGIRCTGSSPTIRNCIFRKNSADECGGGLCNTYGSHPIVIGCTFENNTCVVKRVAGSGGGMANLQESSPTVEDCTFAGNSASLTGGALANFTGGNARVTRCVFNGNSGEQGGAIDSRSSRPVFSRCVFSGNSAKTAGAMSISENSDVVVSNCIFSGNLAERTGGAILVGKSAALMVNCTISGNQAGQKYGGVVSSGGGVLRMEDCILWGNVDTANGSGVEPAQIARDRGEIVMGYCCVEGLTGTLGGIGNIGADPLFVDVANGDHHLRTQGRRWDDVQSRWTRDSDTSPCIDAGNPGRSLGDEPAAAPGDPNSPPGTNPRVDMGAYGGTAEASVAPTHWMLLADITNDMRVDWLDLAHLAADWATFGENRPGDLSRDGATGGADLVLLGTQWRERAEPAGSAQEAVDN